MNNSFIDYMEFHRNKFQESVFPYKYYGQIQRSFRNTNNPNHLEHLIYIHESGTSIHDGEFLDIYILIGRLYSKNLISKDGISFGEALSKISRNEKFIQGVIKSDRVRLISQMDKVSGMFSAENVKLNPYGIFDMLASWETQSKSKNKNWCKKQIIKDYYSNKIKKDDL